MQIIVGDCTDGTGDVQEVHLVYRMVDKRVCYFQTPSVSLKSFFYLCFSFLICKIILIMVLLKGYDEIVYPLIGVSYLQQC